MLPCGLQQTLFAKFLSVTIQGFGNTIGVEQNGVALSQFAFFHGAIPFVEQAHHRAGCCEPFHSVVAAQKQGRWMAAVRVAQLARAIIVFGEEESSVIPTPRVFVGDDQGAGRAFGGWRIRAQTLILAFFPTREEKGLCLT